jgi:hypothetical protein
MTNRVEIRTATKAANLKCSKGRESDLTTVYGNKTTSMSTRHLFALALRTVLAIVAVIAATYILLAWGLSAYGIYAHVYHTWPTNDPLILLPGSAFAALVPSVLFSIAVLLFRARLSGTVVRSLIFFAFTGFLLLPINFMLICLLG